MTQGHALLVPHATNEHIQKSRAGVYDREILCEECERLFSACDNYAKTFLQDTKWDKVEGVPPESPIGLVVREWDYKLLKLFPLSVLWRAHMTDQSFYGSVDLGPHVQAFAKLIRDQDPGPPDLYPTMLFKFRSTDSVVKPSAGFLNPYRKRVEGRWCYVLSLPDFTFVVQLDRRPPLGPYARIRMDPEEPLAIPLRDFAKSAELRAMVETAQLRRR
jgi:hypothetical protein